MNYGEKCLQRKRKLRMMRYDKAKSAMKVVRPWLGVLFPY